MTFHILTLFPEVFESIFSKSIIKRAIDKKLISVELINIRNWGIGKHKTVDDKPYGGGEGMVMMVEPILKALESIKTSPYVILLCASGRKFTQTKAIKLSAKKNIALICGHYEGVDARVEEFADDVLSIGDFILTGGEIPAMAIIDSVTRFIPGSMNPNSAIDESFQQGLLEYPQYTRPVDFRDLKVPKVLLGGNHQEIAKWRQKEAIKRTQKLRPDLLKVNI